MDDFGLSHCGGQHAQRIVQRTLRLVDDLLRGSADHHGARRAKLHAREADQALVADQYLGKVVKIIFLA